MNKTILFIILLVTNFAIKSSPFSTINMEEKLLNHEWTGFGVLFTYGTMITFAKDKTFNEKLIGEGCIGYSGTFSFNGNQIILTGENESACGPDGFHAKRVCKLVSQSMDPFYSESLICDDGVYYGSGLKPVGATIKIQNVDAVIIEPRKIVARVNIKIREKPLVSSESYFCQLEGGENVPFFPKGRELVLYARTLKKEKITGKEAYWYFARQDLDWYTPCFVKNDYTSLVWVFGGSID
ncbi:hypothetical protein [Leptospira santarosai]|uniref:hypothetical protein n=1 Tax=Leptospira santarosai TaxID=28183 RepID=UPI000A8215ED|nr:hypothetical protein [Leptospira santarosai]